MEGVAGCQIGEDQLHSATTPVARFSFRSVQDADDGRIRVEKGHGWQRASHDSLHVKHPWRCNEGILPSVSTETSVWRRSGSRFRRIHRQARLPCRETSTWFQIQVLVAICCSSLAFPSIFPHRWFLPSVAAPSVWYHACST